MSILIFTPLPQGKAEIAVDTGMPKGDVMEQTTAINALIAFAGIATLGLGDDAAQPQVVIGG